MGFPGGSVPPVWETWVQSLGQEDPLEKEMATHASIPACEIPWTEEPGGLYDTLGVYPQSHKAGITALLELEKNPEG